MPYTTISKLLILNQYFMYHAPHQKPESPLFMRLPGSLFTIRTLPEVFIGNSQMLIFPTFRVFLFRQILLFSHRFESFQ